MTDENKHTQKLFSEFTPATATDWEERARKDLRDTPLEQLTWHTYEGIDIKPYYTRQDLDQLPATRQKPGNYPFTRGTRTAANTWLNIQEIKVEGNGKPAIDKAADALTRGADGIHFILPQPELFDIVYLLSKIDLNKHTVSYTLPNKLDHFPNRLYGKLGANNVSPQKLCGFIKYEPMTAKGELTRDENKAIVELLELTKDSPEFYGITINGTNFSSIGATTVQEIAYTLSAAVAYIHRLTNAGQTVEDVLRNMQFHMAAGTNYFFEIAKLRALRLLWATIVEAYSADKALAGKLRIHSSTSGWYQTTLDPYVNMLRVTTEAMSAVMAGTDSLTVSPFDSTFKASDEFSERIARNVSIILREEAYLDKAIDPAAGSYYLESLTDQLATKAWELFKEVESKGGFEAAYESGFILGSITEVSRQKFRDIAKGSMILVGTNKYPNPKEKIDFDPEELIQSEAFDTTRAAYPTEVMRMATELHLRKRQRRPKAIVAIIGNGEQRQVNATFAKEFFSCAGFETEMQNYSSVEEASDKLQHTAAEILVVSSSEANYVKEFGPRIRNHHAKPTLILADDPQHMKAEMIANGYDEFIFEDCDMGTILEIVHKKLHGDK
ncbi:methylmalonyl-CoA mutase subunit beta [Pontibacter fetidus]|uniref:Methylmalonyl-CoA mutase n=1 Tax=Pontibacter fetidus TaxID=2700082 RepID=A0A6B2H2Z8_9BACT|nr:methylmalonyl-CoA mutase subunit beta [Pontibacter fetidus]NDK54667.1 methylmalonyl-CoA mutase [Pontibacter fetidus]